jgi:type IV pilus assembly protein PilQ
MFLYFVLLIVFLAPTALFGADGDDQKYIKSNGTRDSAGWPVHFRQKTQSNAEIEPFAIKDNPVETVLAGLQAHQGGDSVLILRVRGFELPIPRSVSAPGENKLVLQWDNARFPRNTDKRDWWDEYDWDVLKFPSNKVENDWWKQYDLPLLSRISVSKFDDESMRMTINSPKQLVLDRVDGVEGADSQVIMLKVYSEQAPVRVPTEKTLSKGDPMGINAPVTLKLNDADVKAVFRMLADMQKINLLLDPSVPDSLVTFSFTKTPFNEVFGYLLRMTDLNYAMRGSTLIVGKSESLGKTLGTEVVRAYQISYAVDSSGQVGGDLTSALTGLISLSATPVLDSRNRTLYVTATPEQHEEVAELIEKLDRPGNQIMIQARLVQVTDDASQQLEDLVSVVYDQWLLRFSQGTLSAGYNYGSSVFDATNLNIPIAGVQSDTQVNVQDIAMDSGLKILNAGLSAMESDSKAKTLANPSVITLDGQEATVDMQTSMSYPSGQDENGNQEYETVKGGPLLTFTPVIGRNGMVTIKIDIESSEPPTLRMAGSGSLQVPQIDNRRISTQVRVRNGEPFVVGGLFRDRRDKVRGRIPVLGYIPLLGSLFSTVNNTHTRDEVAMIVIPYILDIPDEEISTFDLMRSSLGK